MAVTLGYLVYRGGMRLNLSRFFRITGVVLVLVAAGLVVSTLRAAYEAGWLTIGQQTALDLSAIARPGSVQESLLTGMLGIRSSLPVVEVVAYLLYAVPMLRWCSGRRSARRPGARLGAILVGTAAAALAVAGACSPRRARGARRRSAARAGPVRARSGHRRGRRGRRPATGHRPLATVTSPRCGDGHASSRRRRPPSDVAAGGAIAGSRARSCRPATPVTTTSPRPAGSAFG